MSKTRLTFEFNLPEDQEEFEIQTQAQTVHTALWDIMNQVLRQYKHVDLGDEAEALLEKIRKDCWEVVSEHGVRGM